VKRAWAQLASSVGFLPATYTADPSLNQGRKYKAVQQPWGAFAGVTVVVPDVCSAGLGAEVSFWQPAIAKTETMVKIAAREIIFFMFIHLLSLCRV
jgi:uncharacterized membrane protein